MKNKIEEELSLPFVNLTVVVLMVVIKKEQNWCWSYSLTYTLNWNLS